MIIYLGVSGRGFKLPTDVHLMPKLRMGGAIPLACTGTEVKVYCPSPHPTSCLISKTANDLHLTLSFGKCSSTVPHTQEHTPSLSQKSVEIYLHSPIQLHCIMRNIQQTDNLTFFKIFFPSIRLAHLKCFDLYTLQFGLIAEGKVFKL